MSIQLPTASQQVIGQPVADADSVRAVFVAKATDGSTAIWAIALPTGSPVRLVAISPSAVGPVVMFVEP